MDGIQILKPSVFVPTRFYGFVPTRFYGFVTARTYGGYYKTEVSPLPQDIKIDSKEASRLGWKLIVDAHYGSRVIFTENKVL